MKFILFLIIFLFISASSLYSGPFVKFEIGPSLNVDNIYFAQVDIGWILRWKWLKSTTYGGWLTWSEYNYPKSARPFTDIYMFGQKINYGRFFLRFQHYCAHVVFSETKSYIDKNSAITHNEYVVTPYWWAGNMETLSVGFEYELK